MDEKRQKILIRSLRTTGRLFNMLGSQYWTEKRERVKEDKKPW
jgi:hypothetical protein